MNEQWVTHGTKAQWQAERDAEAAEFEALLIRLGASGDRQGAYHLAYAYFSIRTPEGRVHFVQALAPILGMDEIALGNRLAYYRDRIQAEMAHA